MSSASSAVAYTSVYTDSEPGRVFWGADEELSDGGSLRVIVYGYDGLPMQPVASSSLDYVSGPEHPPSPVEVPYVPEPELIADFNLEEDPEEDSEEDHADYPADRGDDDYKPSDDDDDDDDDTNDDDTEAFETDEAAPTHVPSPRRHTARMSVRPQTPVPFVETLIDDKEEEEHLDPTDSPAAPVIDHVPSAEDTKAFETDEVPPTHVPSPRRHTARMSIRPQTHVPLLSEAEIPSLSSLHLPPPVPISLPLPLSPLPPLPASLFIPPVDRKEDTSEAELPPRKRLCLTALTSRYEEQDTQDVYAVIEDTQDRQTQIYQRVDILAEDRQFHYETARLLDQEALVIIQQDFDNLEAELRESRTQIAKLQRKQMGNNSKIALAHFRIANLEQIIEDIQARHQADKESLLNAIYEHKNSQEGPSDY
ncbi:hypothetical protein Tco_0341426 [Tanacetum coccineum]